jgi:hypothetical protein
MDEESAEKTLTNLFNSKLIGNEIEYMEISDDPIDDLEVDPLERTYEVFIKFQFCKL